jgi:hypothetical protein
MFVSTAIKLMSIRVAWLVAPCRCGRGQSRCAVQLPRVTDNLIAEYASVRSADKRARVSFQLFFPPLFFHLSLLRANFVQSVMHRSHLVLRIGYCKVKDLFQYRFVPILCEPHPEESVLTILTMTMMT